MVELISYILGGVGFFILGMVLMTDSLKNLSGDSMKKILEKFTGGIFISIVTGIVVTTIFQSSHATILTTMGFVSAGILKFEQSIGVILGANLGTTSTGWLVSLVGFKLSLGKLAFPFIGIGATLKLLFKRKIGEIGLFLCGFSLLFIGIEFLQIGMKSLTNYIQPNQILADTWSHKAMLVGLGIGLTILMQSSSAALATTLAALSQSAIDLQQASYMVIGQNIGTTLTAGIAAIGASVSSKRTALVHILFNILAGTVAFFLLDFLLYFIQILLGKNFEAVSAVVFFHSLFNVIGIFVFLPILKPISRFLEKILPDEISNPNRYLDVLLYNTPALALDAVQRSLLEMFYTFVAQIQFKIEQNKSVADFIQIQRLQLKELMRYFEKIPSNNISEKEMQLKSNLLHCMDHLDSLLDALGNLEAQDFDFQIPKLQNLKKELLDTIKIILTEGITHSSEKVLEDKSKDLANFRKKTRLEVLETAAKAKFHPEKALKEIDTIRWFDKVHYYLWRFVKHIY